MRPGDRVSAGADCGITLEGPRAEIWVNEGEEGTVLRVEDYVEYAEARPMKVGSTAEKMLLSGKNPPHEKRRFIRLLVKFDFGMTIQIDADKVSVKS
ncbi:hypothetical protein [Amycolatopsis taiwanensis]|uniref:Uncharacterized protein n=1 Tax=Amycolatopsis taiwanensis TaxID=342230 RepID=A0A9W6R850_9PSEU|nr:hypothetical protein [Amycolatopsis taiwanensis]GLY70906.1 hypothetical protein Atai01_75250 [Amycolatopsis taiwanensis]